MAQGVTMGRLRRDHYATQMHPFLSGRYNARWIASECSVRLGYSRVVVQVRLHHVQYWTYLQSNGRCAIVTEQLTA